MQQLQVARQFGVGRVVLANQLVGKQAIRFVVSELQRDPGFDFYCLVDSAENVASLAAAARKAGLQRPIQVLLEGGYPGGRTGVRDLAAALSVARAVKDASPVIAVRGVEGFEGLFHSPTPAETEAQVARFLGFLVDIAVVAAHESLFAPGTFDSQRRRIGVLRSGGPPLQGSWARPRVHDPDPQRLLSHARLVLYREAFAALCARSTQAASLGPGLRPALELWAYVQSRPDPEKAPLTIGKRDVSYDEPPVALHWAPPGDC